MLKPDDLLAISLEYDLQGLKGLSNEILWLAKYPKTMTPYFKRNFPDCYKALRAPLRDVPKYINSYPIIAKYRLKKGR